MYLKPLNGAQDNEQKETRHGARDTEKKVEGKRHKVGDRKQEAMVRKIYR